MGGNVFHVVIAPPIAKWELMYGGMRNGVKILCEVHAWGVECAPPFAQGVF